MNKLELAPEFIQSIDWELLKEQKSDLLNAREDFEMDAKNAASAGQEELAKRYERQVNSITGIIHLLDALQDYVVDFCELPEEKVFKLNTEFTHYELAVDSEHWKDFKSLKVSGEKTSEEPENWQMTVKENDELHFYNYDFETEYKSDLSLLQERIK